MVRETFPVGPLQCNCTILGNELSKDATVVDPGGDIAKIEATLARHGFQVKQIVVTHAHLDHIAGAKLLSSRTGAPVLYNQRDLPLVAMMAEQAAWMGVTTPEVSAPDQSAEDGLELQVGSDSLLVLHTPGHTQGSISLLLPQQNLLLAGDTLFHGSVGRTDLPGGNTVQLLHSIADRLLHLPECTIVVPGHGRETTIGFEREHNPFLQNV